MPAPPLSNTFEGGSNGTALSVANTGGASGDAASSITDPNVIQKFSSAQAAHGTLSMNITQTATAASTRWDWQGLGAITADLYIRQYLYLPALPSAAFIFCGVRSSAAAALSTQFQIETTGKVTLTLASAAAGLTSTASVTANQWFRLECRVRSSATVGQLEFRLFKTLDSTTADDTGSATGLVLGADSDQIRWGHVTNPIASFVSYHDDVAVSTANWIGPAGGAAPGVRPTFNPLPFLPL